MQRKNILEELQQYDNITVQCHDNPDADAIASAFGVYTYFKELGKNVRMIYSGKTNQMKSNLKIMIEELHIPAEYVCEMPESELLICVDCQYGEGNVTRFPAKKIAVLDHHLNAGHTTDYSDIRSAYGSCATLIYKCLEDCGYDLKKNKDLSTALYYGLFMDTNEFGEMEHPYDFDMVDELEIDKNILTKMRNANFTLSELETAAVALLRYNYNPEQRIAYIRSNPCDRNMLGVVSDLLIQVDSVDTCIVYAEDNDGYRISARTCGERVTAEDLVVFLTDKVGNGGGHANKAGGFIEKKRIKSLGGYTSIENYIYMKTGQFMDSYEFLDTTKTPVITQDMECCRQLSNLHLVINPADIMPEGTECYIRHIDGNLNFYISFDTYIVINKNGYVHAIDKTEFERCYHYADFPFSLEAEYMPKLINTLTNENFDIISAGTACISNKTACYYAKRLTKNLRLRNHWDKENGNCQRGKTGDYLLVNMRNEKDCFIVQKNQYETEYERLSGG